MTPHVVRVYNAAKDIFVRMNFSALNFPHSLVSLIIIFAIFGGTLEEVHIFNVLFLIVALGVVTPRFGYRAGFTSLLSFLWVYCQQSMSQQPVLSYVNLDQFVRIFPNLDVKNFVLATLFGQRQVLDVEVVEQFRRLGLYHLLIISGLHISLIAILLNSLLLYGLQALYALRLWPAKIWTATVASLRIAPIVPMFVFICVIGIPVSSQRAFLIFSISVTMLTFYGKAPILARLRVVFLMQIILFPQDLVSTGSILSWLTYIFVIDTAKTSQCFLESKRFYRYYLSWLICQIKLVVVVGALIGEISLAGILVNIFIVPIFSFLYTLMLLGISTHKFTDLLVVGAQNGILLVLDLTANLARFVDQFRWLYLQFSGSTFWRIAFLLGSGVIFLKTLKNLTIPKQGGVQ